MEALPPLGIYRAHLLGIRPAAIHHLLLWVLTSGRLYILTPDLSFATSAFGTHTITSTVSVVTSIMAGVAKPFLAKAADITTRPLVVACSVGFFAVGFAMVAGSKTVDTVVAGEVIYTIGNTGISFSETPWRSFLS